MFRAASLVGDHEGYQHTVYISFFNPLIQHVYKGCLFWFVYRCIIHV